VIHVGVHAPRFGPCQPWEPQKILPGPNEILSKSSAWNDIAASKLDDAEIISFSQCGGEAARVTGDSSRRLPGVLSVDRDRQHAAEKNHEL
jgi:hypothetical protein